jgi:hypothetical protein
MNVSSLHKFSQSLRELPRTIAKDVAFEAAPVITEFAQESFDKSEDPYGAAWAPGHDGKKVKLQDTGALRRFIRYVAIGTKLRVSLGVKYAKYQIGKRPVYPRQGGVLPKKYTDALTEIVQRFGKFYLGGK